MSSTAACERPARVHPTAAGSNRRRWFNRPAGPVALSFLLLGLCSCATPYRPLKSGTGFTEVQLDTNEFQVRFQGNGHNTSEEVQDYALLRSAQVALQHGFSYFTVADVTNTSSAKSYTAQQQFHADYPPDMGLPPPTPGGYDPYRAGYFVTYDEPRTYFRPGTSFRIKCFTTKPDNLFSYDAAGLERSLKQKYKLT